MLRPGATRNRPEAQIEPAGLFYGYTVDDAGYPGRVTFIPFDQLP